MSQSISASKKSRGRPKTTGAGEQVVVRLHDPMLSAIDRLRTEPLIGGDPSRAEVIRYILLDWLVGHGYVPPPPHQAESDL